MVTKQNRWKLLVLSILSISVLGGVALGATTLVNMQIISWTTTIGSPTALSFSTSLIASSSEQTLEQAFSGANDYFFVQDLKGTDPWYSTTLQLSGALTAGSNTIPTANVYFKTLSATPDFLSGTVNPRVVLDGAAVSYQNLSAARTFILRANAANSWVIGKYGSKVSLRIDVPAWQAIGTYSTNLVYTLIEN